MSKGWVGKAYDYNQLKDEFSPDQSWFTDLPVRLDLGYLGFSKDYACQSVSHPALSRKWSHKSKSKTGTLLIATRDDVRNVKWVMYAH